MNQEERRKAAKGIHANPLLSECFENAIKNCFDAWVADPNSKDRDLLWHRMKAIQLVRIEINAAVKSALRDEQQQQPSA